MSDDQRPKQQLTPFASVVFNVGATVLPISLVVLVLCLAGMARTVFERCTFEGDVSNEDGSDATDYAQLVTFTSQYLWYSGQAALTAVVTALLMLVVAMVGSVPASPEARHER